VPKGFGTSWDYTTSRVLLVGQSWTKSLNKQYSEMIFSRMLQIK